MDLAEPPIVDEIEQQRVVAEAEARLFGTTAREVKVGRFVVRRRLGLGGLGVVYAAHDPELDREVAVKLLRPDRGGDHDRLRREARAMAKLAHPNVVPVYEVGTHGERVFLAMELVAGRTLRAWTAEADWRAIVRAYVAAGRGLVAAHEAGIVHRDFKPDNVLVGADGRPRVTDFGLVGETAIAGTPAYMAPEQHAGREVTPAADQFAFCVALHEALYGTRPFSGEDRTAAGGAENDLFAAKTVGAVAEPTPASPVPRRIWLALRKGFAPRPAERWPSLAALLDAIETAPRRRVLRWVVIGVVAALLVTALIAAVLQMWMFNDWMGRR